MSNVAACTKLTRPAQLQPQARYHLSCVRPGLAHAFPLLSYTLDVSAIDQALPIPQVLFPV